MWKNLNEKMLKHKFLKPNFKGFMVDNEEANWNTVKIVYGSEAPFLSRWLIRSVLIYSIGVIHLISTPNN
jgi:hypothetical protein